MACVSFHTSGQFLKCSKLHLSTWSEIVFDHALQRFSSFLLFLLADFQGEAADEDVESSGGVVFRIRQSCGEQ